MAKCTCPEGLESMSQLCASCEADYLKYLEEIERKENREPETSANGAAVTLEEITKQFTTLEDYTLDECAKNAVKLGEMLPRLMAVETNQRTHRAAIEALGQRITALANLIGMTREAA